MAEHQEKQERYWQNWDKGDASKRIDAYWLASEEHWRASLVKDLGDELAKHAQITEVGCGSGLIFQAMNQRNIVTPASYMGGDISKSMLDIARKRFPQARFQELDIFNINLPDKSQPNVINIHVLQHLPYYDKPVQELLRITQKRLYIACWFKQQTADEIAFSEPSENWDNQAFQNNCYSLPKFVNFIIEHSERPIEEMRIHHFGGQNYSICISFVPPDPAKPGFFAKVRWKIRHLMK